MTRWSILFTLILSVAVVAGCGKKKGESAAEGEAGTTESAGGETPTGEEPITVKADLTSPKAAFESFSETMETLKKRYMGKLESIFKGSEADMYAPVMTAELVTFLTDRDKKRMTKEVDTDEGKLVFDKEEKAEGEDVLILANQKVTKKTVERDPKTGKEDTKTEDKNKKHKMLFTKAGEAWRLKTWHEECFSCEGKGKCSECDGTGKSKPKDCFACNGSGKSGSGEKCFGCDGTGKEKSRDCFFCNENKGKCGTCEGEGWKRQDDFEGGGFFGGEVKKVEKFSDLSTPENTARTYINLAELRETEALQTFGSMMGAVKKMVEALFTADALERLNKNQEKAAEEQKKREAGTKKEVGDHKMAEGKAIVILSETRTDPEGKAHTSRTALRMVKTGNEWKVEDRGQPCWGCGGTGECDGCGGTGTTKVEDCWSCKGKGKDDQGEKCFMCEGSGKTKPDKCMQCKETKGKCQGCKGAMFSWDRAKEKEKEEEK
ncbi:MAG: hypothetical protein ACYS47_12500 [Planctomycetota bacterium]|jgi:hypothetical protein